MDPEFLQRLHVLLEHCLAPDTQVIKQATAELNMHFYKQPLSIPALFQITCSSENQGVRQLAATELRKRILAKDGKLWQQVGADTRSQIRAELLNRLLSEPSKLIRHSLARAIVVIADFELPIPQPQWPELLPFLHSNSQSANASQREAAIFVLFLLIDTIHDATDGTQNRASFDELFGLFGRAISDPESEDVRIDALRAMGKLAEYIEPDQKELIKQYQSLIVPMLTVLQNIVASGNTEGSKHGLDVFETLLLLDTPLISKHVAEFTAFCLTVATNQEVDDEIRCAALNSLTWTIQYKKTRVQSLNLAKDIIERLLVIGSESEPEDEDEDSASRLAFRALDELAKALPPQQVFPALSPQLQQYLSSSNPQQRRCALMAFGVTVEGVSEYIRPHVAQLWPLIDQGLADPDPIVRKAGCVALACVCEWLQDESAERHAQIVPVLFNLITDPLTQKAATAALEAYLEILGDNIGQYLTLLMERLIILLETAPDNVKATVTGAIGSAAFASKEAFKPYFAETARRLIQFLNLTGDGDEASLRGVTMDTLGTFAEVVGKEMFAPYFPDMMKYAINAVNTEDSRARETSFMFFGTMAGVFGDDFAPYLPQVVPPLLVSIMQSEANQFEDDDPATAQMSAQQAVAAFNATASSSKITDENIDSESEEDIDDLDAMFGGVNSEVAIEKEIAVEVVGQIFEAAKTHYTPYLEETVKILIDKLEHYYEGIRKSAINSLLTIIKTFYEMSNPADWEGATEVPALHPDVKALIETIMPRILEAWATEDDKQVVIRLCVALSEVINTVGPAFLEEGRLQVIVLCCQALLENRADCQQDADFEEDGPEGEASEYESVVISSAVDVVAAITNVLGSTFAADFAPFLPLITKYYDPKRSVSERSMTIGSLGEIIVGLQGGITQYTESILQILARALQDPEAEVRSNAAYASGAIIEWSDVDLTGQFVNLLGALQPFFNVTEASSKDELNAKDNAAGAVARMIVKSPQSLPLPAVLPLFFGALPLKNDTIENKAVFDAIFKLFEVQPDLMLQNIDQLLPIFAYVLDPVRGDDLTEATRSRLIELVQHLRQQVPDKVAAAGLH